MDGFVFDVFHENDGSDVIDLTADSPIDSSSSSLSTVVPATVLQNIPEITPSSSSSTTTPGGNRKVGFGKYFNLTFDQLRRKDAGYCRWVMGVDAPRGDQMKKLKSYLNSAEGKATPGPLVIQNGDDDDDNDGGGLGASGNQISEAHEKDLLTLLQNAEQTDSITPIHLRIKTPPEMTIQLLPHQQLGVEWMLKMEELGTNKGGILADDSKDGVSKISG